MTTADYLTQLEQDREDLVDNLETKGITGLSGDETFTELVPEVLNISGGSSKFTPRHISFYSYGGAELNDEISKIDTSKVTSMSNMFTMCQNLTSLDLSSLNTSKVTDMSNMFNNCTLLENLNLSNINTSNVISFNNTFYNCSRLTGLDLSSFNTEKAENFSGMFLGCGITSLNISNFNKPVVWGLSNMFQTCSNLTTLNFGSFNIPKLQQSRAMFYNCYKLETITFSDAQTVKSYPEWTICSQMFYNCTKLEEMNLSFIGATKLYDFSNMFSGCSIITKVNLANLTTSTTYGVNCTNMFSYAKLLTEIDMRSFDFTKITSNSNMFGASSSNGVPDNCLIIVADDTQKTWLTGKFSRLTNIKTVAEL